jgi:hypothetical protein
MAGLERLVPRPGEHPAGQPPNRLFVVYDEHGKTAGWAFRLFR